MLLNNICMEIEREVKERRRKERMFPMVGEAHTKALCSILEEVSELLGDAVPRTETIK